MVIVHLNEYILVRSVITFQIDSTLKPVACKRKFILSSCAFAYNDIYRYLIQFFAMIIFRTINFKNNVNEVLILIQSFTNL